LADRSIVGPFQAHQSFQPISHVVCCFPTLLNRAFATWSHQNNRRKEEVRQNREVYLSNWWGGGGLGLSVLFQNSHLGEREGILYNPVTKSSLERFCVLLQFSYDGCDNCPFLKMEEDADHVRECTSPNFNGLAAVIEPATSWTAKWQHLSMHSSWATPLARLYSATKTFKLPLGPDRILT
jgi:hypothetical protein